MIQRLKRLLSLKIVHMIYSKGQIICQLKVQILDKKGIFFYGNVYIYLLEIYMKERVLVLRVLVYDYSLGNDLEER